MITKLINTLAAVVLFALPASADFQLDRVQWLFDSDCTDANDTPATTVNVAVNDLANWNTLGEAIDPSLNENDAVQTSGSADGWCDDAPYRIRGNWTTTGNQTVLIGPVRVPDSGFAVVQDWTSVGTDYSWDFSYQPPWAATTANWSQINDSTTTGDTVGLISPLTETSGNIVSHGAANFPAGMLYYLKLDLDGAGTWTVDASFHPLRSHYQDR